MSKTNFFFYYKDSVGKNWTISFIPNEYLNLMALIFDQGYEDWGDCKGRAWCGTCHIKVETLSEEVVQEELHTLGKLPNRQEKSRLACQIPINEDLHEKYIQFLGDFD